MNPHQDDPWVIKEKKKKKDNIMFTYIYVGRQEANW